MKNRIALLLLIIGISFQFVNAQQNRLQKADRYLELFKFDKAVKQYEKVLKKHPDNFEAMHGLATIYRVKGDYASAVDWYRQLMKQDEKVKAEDYLHYGQCLRFVQDYNLARDNFKVYAELKPEDQRGELLSVGYEELLPLITDSLNWGIEYLKFNNDAQEFSPAYYKDNSITFPSSRNEDTKVDQRWYETPFLDIYVSELTDTGHAKPSLLNSKVNNRYHEGPMTFDTSFTTMYFTRNNYVKRKKETGDDDIMRLKIFSAKYQEGKDDESNWVDVTELPFNSDDYSVGHPTLTQDGKTLYFSSDMPDGEGGLDLYKVEVKGDGEYGEPESLGPEINTPGNESFPYIHPSGTLYFASDSRKGLGGLDIYFSDFKNGIWSTPENMGYPINTNYDDFGLIMNKEKDGGYLSSNRNGNYVNDDIYSFDDRGLFLKGFVYDLLTKERLDSSTVFLVENGDTLEKKITNPEGEFGFWVALDNIYDLKASKPTYRPNELRLSTEGLRGDVPLFKIPLDRGQLVLQGRVLESKTEEPIPEAMVLLQNEEEGITDTTYSGEDGSYAFVLKEGNEYVLSAEKYAWFLNSEKTVNTEGVPVPGTIEQDLMMSKLETGAVIKLENIYYDFDKYNIRPDAAEELDRVAEYLEKYPELVIQLRSHTDSRASDPYNMWLSARRAESAANYLLKNGGELYQLTAMGFGETRLVNECSNGVECSEEKHQDNRRTEFKVIKQPNSIQIKGSVL